MEIQGYNLPDELYYEEHHFWIRPDGDILIMGMTDFAHRNAAKPVRGPLLISRSLCSRASQCPGPGGEHHCGEPRLSRSLRTVGRR